MLSSRMDSALPAMAWSSSTCVRTSTWTIWPGLRPASARRERRGKAAAEGDVVVLDQDAVLQVEAVVEAAAAADGVFIERAQAGDGLAGVEDFGLRLHGGDGADVLVGERGDAGHALHQVEDDALGGEDAGGVGADDGDGLALFGSWTPSKISGWLTTSKRPMSGWRAC